MPVQCAARAALDSPFPTPPRGRACPGHPRHEESQSWRLKTWVPGTRPGTGYFENGSSSVWVGLSPERVIDDRLLLGSQRVVQSFERRAGLLHRLQACLKKLLPPAHAVEDRSLPLLPGFRRQLVAELAFLVAGRLHRCIELVPE